MALSKEGIASEQVESILNALQTQECDFESISQQDQAMLRYAMKLTRTPTEMNQNDVEQLRVAGFDDLEIHDIACIVGYFAFVNRIADGLGVELEK